MNKRQKRNNNNDSTRGVGLAITTHPIGVGGVRLLQVVSEHLGSTLGLHGLFHWQVATKFSKRGFIMIFSKLDKLMFRC